MLDDGKLISRIYKISNKYDLQFTLGNVRNMSTRLRKHELTEQKPYGKPEYSGRMPTIRWTG